MANRPHLGVVVYLARYMTDTRGTASLAQSKADVIKGISPYVDHGWIARRLGKEHSLVWVS